MLTAVVRSESKTERTQTQSPLIYHGGGEVTRWDGHETPKGLFAGEWRKFRHPAGNHDEVGSDPSCSAGPHPRSAGRALDIDRLGVASRRAVGVFNR
jgi:hypothetical protein